MSPEVTVVIPTRNRCALLATTLRTVLAQEGVALEVVAVDEASDDGTAALLGDHGDARVRHIRHERPLGVARARNRGIAEARGRWVAFLDDDDLWAPDKLAAQLRAAEEAGARWVCSGAVAVDTELEVVDVYRPPTPEQLCELLDRRNPVPAGSSNVVVRTDLLAEVGGLDPALRHLADWDLWRRLGGAARPGIVAAPAVAYRLHASNASRATSGIIQEATLLEQRAGRPIDWGAIHRWMGVHELREGRRRAAAAAFLRAAGTGDRRSVLRAANAMVLPGARTRLRHRPFRPDRQVDDHEYKELADRWLGPLRA